jgi:hypothetical protein
VTTEERFKTDENFALSFDEARREHPPTFERLRCRTQGQILFLGAYWMYAHEARALRDWLNKVLPDG